MLRLLELHAPLKAVRLKEISTPWFDFDVSKAMVDRDLAYSDSDVALRRASIYLRT